MASAPPPPPGWRPQPVTPASRQQAQDTVLGYLKKTLRALPTGTTLDATRYGGGTGTAPCDDVITGTPAVELSTIGELRLPPGVAPDAVVARIGDIWKSWGWHAFERDGLRKPNRTGFAPDGYRLIIEAKQATSDPPTLIGISPCFPGDLPDNSSPFPVVLTGD